MNWPELALSPNASLRVPGVNVPVAAPSWAVVLMSFPSWRRERPCAGGNWSARGCWAGPSWAIAGGGELVAVVLVLANRLDALGCEHRSLTAPATVETLVAMRLNALLVDPAVLGPAGWEYLARVCARLPGLAVIVCTGPSSVAQRVRGLRLGADAWITKPCHAEELICVIEAAVRRHRRAEMPALEAAARFGEITVRPDLYQAYANDVSLELT